MDILRQNPPDSNLTRHCNGCDTTYPATLEFFPPEKKGKYGLSSRCRICSRIRQKKHRSKPEKHEQHISYMKEYHARPERQEHDKAYNRTTERRTYMRDYMRERYKRLDIQEYYKTYHQRPEVRERRRRFYATPKQRMLRSIRSKQHNSLPEVQSQQKEYRRLYYQRPEVRENKRLWHKTYYSRPEIRERHRVYGKTYRERPGSRSKFSAYARNRLARQQSVLGTHTSAQIQEQLKRQRYCCYYAECGHAKFEKEKGKYTYHVDHTFPLSRVVGSDIPANDMSYLVLTCPHCNVSKHNKFPWEWPEGGRLL